MDMVSTAAPHGAAAARSPVLSDIGGRVRRERNRQRLSRRLLSERCGVSERFLAQLEHGSGNISVLRLKAVADALGMSLATLVAEAGAALAPAAPDWRAPAAAGVFRHAAPLEPEMALNVLVAASRRAGHRA